MRSFLKTFLIPALALGVWVGTMLPIRAQVANVDFYVFALSWSPGFCALEGAEKGREQCALGQGTRFVVHGLWPQRGGESDINCPAGQRPIPRPVLEEARGLFPDEGLARYQWRKHGGCSGLAPSAWLADVRRAREAVVVPPTFQTVQHDMRMSPEDILRAFREANPRLRSGMAAVACPRNVFQEIRICMSRDLRDFVSCPQIVQQSCRAQAISVRPPA